MVVSVAAEIAIHLIVIYDAQKIVGGKSLLY